MVIVGLGWSFMVIDGHFMQMPLQEANTPVRKKVLGGRTWADEPTASWWNPRAPLTMLNGALEIDVSSTHTRALNIVCRGTGVGVANAGAIQFFGRACRFHDHQGPSMIVNDHQ